MKTNNVIARNEAISELWRSRKGIFLMLIGLLLTVNVWAQSGDTTHKDTSTKFIVRDPILPKNNKILLVINGEKFYSDSYSSLLPDTADILYVNVLKGKHAEENYGKKGANGVVIIVTKSYAIQQYQKKFSAFSKEYRHYLGNNQNNDENASYVLNGRFLSVKPFERAKELYEIPAAEIKVIELTENQFYNGGDSRPYIVIITTKK